MLHPEPPKLTDEDLLETARLAVVGGLAGDAAHELNNPLFAILGLVELLLHEVEPDSKVGQRLVLVQQTGLRMKQIIRTLVDFARDAQRETALVELEEIALRAAELARSTCAAHDVEIVVRTENGPLTVECGPAYLVSALIDLIGKARKALPFGGAVTLSVGPADGSGSITITASGEQVDRQAAGTAVAETVIQMCGGTLLQGPGPEFVVHLPLRIEDEA